MKLRNIPGGRDKATLELVLHNDQRKDILDAFARFAARHGAEPILERARTIRGVTFVPVRAPSARVAELATFQFVRVVRGMPTLRPFRPGVVRSTPAEDVTLPDTDVLGASRAVVFDGGLPPSHGLDRWVQTIEPQGIGTAHPDYQDHGLAVTGTFLFGHLHDRVLPRPYCLVDHVRVLDDQTGQGGNDLEILDVLDRIVAHLNAHRGTYRFVNISLGPELPITDDEVTQWTATLDELFAGKNVVPTVAVGNGGELDHASGLDRLQPPADAVNASRSVPVIRVRRRGDERPTVASVRAGARAS